MAERPSDNLEWASAPPPGSIVAPTSGQRNDGWSLTDLPRAELDNWQKELTYRWVDWLDQSLRSFAGTLFENQRALAGGTPPVVAAGFTLLPGAFSASIVWGSNQVQANSEVVNMVASRRYYADLSVNGTWTIIQTTLGAAAPAVTANSVRIYIWTTGAAGIDAVTDLRPTRSAARGSALAFTGSLEVGAERDYDEPALVARLRGDDVGAAYTEVFLGDVDNSSLLGRARLYTTSIGGPRRFVAVFGARFVGGAGNQWTAEIDAPTRFDFGNGQMRSSRATGVLATASIADADWYDPAVSDTRTETRGLRHLSVGAGLVPAITGDLGASPCPYVVLAQHSTTTIYLGPEPGGAGSTHGLLVAVNAVVEEITPGSGTYRWRRPITGQTARLFTWDRSRGRRELRYVQPGGPNTWSNTIDEATAWSAYESVTVRLSGIAGSAPGWGSLNGVSSAAPIPGNPWNFSRIIQATGGDAGAWWELTPGLVPDGAILDSFAVTYIRSAGQPGTVQASLCRHAIGTPNATLESLRSSANFTTEDSLPDAPLGTTSATYALGATELNRTALHASYKYGVLIRALTAGTSAEICEVVVTFRRRPL